jgi:hypothetical protein
MVTGVVVHGGARNGDRSFDLGEDEIGVRSLTTGPPAAREVFNYTDDRAVSGWHRF